MVSTADLTERVTFQQPTRVSDGAGGYTQSWGNIATDPSVWAKVRPLQGSARLQAMQMDLTKTHEITIRQRSDLTLKMRVIWNGLVLRLADLPKPLQGGAFMVLLAEMVD